MIFNKPPFVRPRKDELSLVVVHFNAGGGSAAKMYNVLRGRYLSCHYHVASTGEVTQYADEELVTLHAGAVNGRSIGIECQSRGVLLGRAPRKGELYYQDTLHGKQRNDWVAFAEPQRAALAELVLGICQRHGIPPRIPMLDCNHAIRGVCEGWETYAGVLGHYMITAKKMDPGPRELDLLARAFHGAPLPVAG